LPQVWPRLKPRDTELTRAARPIAPASAAAPPW